MNGTDGGIFTYNLSSCVMKYVMMKVWHMFDEEGLFLDYTVNKKGDKSKIWYQVTVNEGESDSEISEAE